MKQIKKIEQKREEKKKQPKKIKDVTVNEGNEASRLIKLVVGVLAFVLVFYLITVLLTKKDSSEKEKEETKIQYTEILVGEMWNQGGTYYVLASKEEEAIESSLEAYLELYHTKHSDISYYVVDLKNGFNRNYVAEESNFYPANHSEIRFKGTTLLKFVDGYLTEHYEGREAILNHLDSIM